MLSLAKLKKDMEFMRDMEGIVDIFKTAALIQFRLFQSKDAANEVFLKELESSWQMLSGRRFSSIYVTSSSGGQTPLKGRAARLPKAIVLVTSDEGFLGGLNTLVMDIGMQRSTSAEDEIIVLGERGAYSLREKRIRFVSFPGIDEDVSPDRVQKLAGHLMKGYYKKFREVFIVYPEFISLTAQRVMTVNLLPYVLPKIPPAKKLRLPEDIIVEPSERDVARVFVELWLGYKLLEIFLSAKQAEYAARIMHLEGSLQEISGLKEKLANSYFRKIHALQDKTIREISASKILMGKRG